MTQAYLCFTLVGFVVVGLCHDIFRTCSPINAHYDSESAYRLMSGNEDDAVSLPFCSGSSSTDPSSKARSLLNTVRGKHPWTRLENMELMWCYYKARAAGRGYQKRLKVIWDGRNPDKLFRSTNNLACQARAIINSKLLSEYELKDIRQRVVSAEAGPSDISDISIREGTSLVEETVISTVPQPPEVLVDGVSEFECLSIYVEECLMDNSISEDLREAFCQILTCLSEVGSLDFAVRSALPKLTESKLVK